METIYSLFSLFTSKHKDSSVKYFLLKMKPTKPTEFSLSS